MDDSTVTLLLGMALGLAVVGVAIGFLLLTARASATSLSAPPLKYSNEERWSIVKDGNGRVKDIVVHREAKRQP